MFKKIVLQWEYVGQKITVQKFCVFPGRAFSQQFQGRLSCNESYRIGDNCFRFHNNSKQLTAVQWKGQEITVPKCCTFPEF